MSDAGAKVRKEYGVPSMLGLLPGRVTYVIDREGIIRVSGQCLRPPHAIAPRRCRVSSGERLCCSVLNCSTEALGGIVPSTRLGAKDGPSPEDPLWTQR